MSKHRKPEPFRVGQHRKHGRASWWATWWRLLTGASPLRTPLVPASLMLAALANQPHPARGVIPTIPRQQLQEVSP